jgi:hypothetical protein
MSMFEDLRYLIDNQPKLAGQSSSEGRRAYTRWWNACCNLSTTMMEEWACAYGVVQTGGELSWHRLHGKHPPWSLRFGYPEEEKIKPWYSEISNRTPGAIPFMDHTTWWRKAKVERGKNHFLEVIVTQPYQNINDNRVINIWKEFAQAKNLAFWISTRPGWHSPGHVLFMEWCSPASRFNQIRASAQAHRLSDTLMCFQPQA